VYLIFGYFCSTFQRTEQDRPYEKDNEKDNEKDCEKDRPIQEATGQARAESPQSEARGAGREGEARQQGQGIYQGTYQGAREGPPFHRGPPQGIEAAPARDQRPRRGRLGAGMGRGHLHADRRRGGARPPERDTVAHAP
jgi:hypothetical protein